MAGDKREEDLIDAEYVRVTRRHGELFSLRLNGWPDEGHFNICVMPDRDALWEAGVTKDGMIRASLAMADTAYGELAARLVPRGWEVMPAGVFKDETVEIQLKAPSEAHLTQDGGDMLDTQAMQRLNEDEQFWRAQIAKPIQDAVHAFEATVEVLRAAHPPEAIKPVKLLSALQTAQSVLLN
jgi:hypothetical protein